MGTLTVCSYNLHGFNQGKSLLVDLCDSCDIIMVQEHWLLPKDLDMINNFNCNFVGVSSSAMGNVIGKGVLKGRPFGGVGMLVNKKHAQTMKYLLNEEGFIVVQIHDLLVINLYLPVLKEAEGYRYYVGTIGLHRKYARTANWFKGFSWR
jgi:hypothetical protein